MACIVFRFHERHGYGATIDLLDHLIQMVGLREALLPVANRTYFGEPRKPVELYEAADAFTGVKADLAACLGGHAGTPVRVRMLWSKGTTTIELGAKSPRTTLVSFSVILCNGEEIRKYQTDLEKIFRRFARTSEWLDSPYWTAIRNNRFQTRITRRIISNLLDSNVTN
ncbi:hypothetical protein ACQR14_36330, partial [Bradyrhizobium oligotrophicum]|uniref:hypothetical protein n=1 Tax=Bradyrhizobium oligotrophicum TaxID=44255 RepID=UPI003EBD7304